MLGRVVSPAASSRIALSRLLPRNAFHCSRWSSSSSNNSSSNNNSSSSSNDGSTGDGDAWSDPVVGLNEWYSPDCTLFSQHRPLWPPAAQENYYNQHQSLVHPSVASTSAPISTSQSYLIHAARNVLAAATTATSSQHHHYHHYHQQQQLPIDERALHLPLDVDIMHDEASTPLLHYHCGSVLKKRAHKMRKHKYRKRLKLTRALRRRQAERKKKEKAREDAQ